MRLLGLVGIVAAVVFPSTAVAATVGVEGDWAVYRSGPTASDVTAYDNLLPGSVFENLSGPLTALSGCEAGPPVRCQVPDVDLRLGAGDDRARAGITNRVKMSSGPGHDLLRASGSNNDVKAGDGDDVVSAGSNSVSTVRGGPGWDVLFGRSLNPSLYGEGGNDFLYADARYPSSISMLDGGADLDRLISTSDSGGTMRGQGGDDILAFTPDDAIPGQDPSWALEGGPGADTIAGSRWSDTVLGGADGDHIDVTGDARADNVTCGGGFDTVYADPEDVVERDCELRYDTPMPYYWALDHAIQRAQGLPEEIELMWATGP